MNRNDPDSREKSNPDKEVKLPETGELEEAFEKVSQSDRFRKSVLSTVNILIVVAAAAVIVAMLLLPVMRIYGDSMDSTLKNGELVVSVKGASFETGDIVAFYYNNNILVKRVIANSGDWVDIDKDGNVYVNNQPIDEPYLPEKSYGTHDIAFPPQPQPVNRVVQRTFDYEAHCRRMMSIEFELTKTELSRVEETKDGTFRIAHSGAELKEVGALFHNCVFSYTEMMNNKMCTIYYLVQQGKARACLEVRDKMIMQASGPCNRRLDKDATTAVLEWAVRHKLKLGTYCMRGH